MANLLLGGMSIGRFLLRNFARPAVQSTVHRAEDEKVPGAKAASPEATWEKMQIWALVQPLAAPPGLLAKQQHSNKSTPRVMRWRLRAPAFNSTAYKHAMALIKEDPGHSF